MTDELKIRVGGDESLATLIYLPGTHGDWTLNGGFRREIGNHVRLVEFTFPRTREWSLDNYADAVEQKLLENNIEQGWILAESFASQIAWAWAGRNSKQFRIEGIILAGGFVRHPIIPAVEMAKVLTRNIPPSMLKMILWLYTLYARNREGDSPEIRSALREFVERRTKVDLLAAAHRLELIAQNDLRSIARQTSVPVFYLTGLFDPIVPWPFVQPWLKNNCRNYGGWKIIGASDHHVLGAAKPSAEQILKWLTQFDKSTKRSPGLSHNLRE